MNLAGETTVTKLMSGTRRKYTGEKCPYITHYGQTGETVEMSGMQPEIAGTGRAVQELRVLFLRADRAHGEYVFKEMKNMRAMRVYT
ncbi:hypothetical protein BCO9919_02525 [Burkholderia cenocepacia]|uniref:Uncharacterized protein n=1 Tax=Burkholderia cenocepacia TaxID=95486 RepID=A0A6J5J5T8_9BURK|nr:MULTISPECIES: hypothetical protein [Burkholderia cepacia complex]CAB3966915.1 hypothetical protein BCO9919_02525 [Burkholderia cenocepacia]